MIKTIKVDYLIKRDTGKKKIEFKPFANKMENLTLIEAPNSSGKSTLLHMIAFSFFGDKNKRIPKELKEKMKSLFDDQKFNFKIEIYDKKNNLILKSEKKKDFDEPDVYEYIKGKEQIITPETFNRKYVLIYDTPQDPINRLDHIFSSFKSDQNNIVSGLHKLIENINNLMREIKDSKDPEKIKEIEKSIELLNKQLEEKEQEFKKKSYEKKELGKFIASKFYFDYLDKIKGIEKSIKYVKDKINDISKSLDKKITKANMSKYLLELEKIEKLRNSISQNIKDFLDSNGKRDLIVWENLSFSRTLDIKKFDSEFEKIALNFNDFLINELKNKFNKEDLEKTKCFEQIIKVLESYKHSKFNISSFGLEISSFIEKLNEEYKESLGNYYKYKNMKQCREDLLNLINKISQFEKYFDELKSAEETEEEENAEEVNIKFQLIKQKENLLKKKENTEKRFKFYSELFKKYNHPRIENIDKKVKEQYHYYSEEQINKVFYELKDKKESLQNSISGLKVNITNNNIRLKKIKELDEHPLFKKFDKIKDFKNSVEELLAIFLNDFNDYINKIEKKKLPDSKNKTNQEFNRALFKLLAKKVDILYHIDKLYHAKEINIIQGIIETKEGDTIRLIHMGTGQTQSAYLNSILNSVKNKKMIILFDEVSMMDKRSISLIFKKMKELYDEGKLLLGLVVKPNDDEILIKSIGDIIG
ncbi:MAG: AAA family ATPase [Promethearchaeota archaeon]